jgi:predicted acylesterase/phospholipase RssA
MIVRHGPFMLLLSVFLVTGCGSVPTRSALTPQQLLDKREAIDRQSEEIMDLIVERNLARLKKEFDDDQAGHAAEKPVVDMLIISGGGDLGAFGAGYLKGWGNVHGELARPEFDVVTGVSTGALIAPFAFLGDEGSYERIAHLYRNPQESWVRRYNPLMVILKKFSSFARVSGLEQEIRKTVDMPMIRRIAEAGTKGRVLVVNTTNLDTGEMRMWDLTQQARRARETRNPDPVIDVMMASSALPAVFPPRHLEGGLYTDGGPTGNMLIFGRTTRRDSETLIVRWQDTYPDIPVPKLRYWIVYNDQMRPPPNVVQPYWKSILEQSMFTSIRAATVRAIQQLFMKAEIARLRYGADIEIRYVAIPDGWVRSQWGIFPKETMNELVDLGEKMGADPASWQTVPP